MIKLSTVLILIFSLTSCFEINTSESGNDKNRQGGNNSNPGTDGRITQGLNADENMNEESTKYLKDICAAFETKQSLFNSPNIGKKFYVDYQYVDCDQPVEKYSHVYKLDYLDQVSNILKFVEVDGKTDPSINDFDTTEYGILARVCTQMKNQPEVPLKVNRFLDSSNTVASRLRVAKSSSPLCTIDDPATQYCVYKEQLRKDERSSEDRFITYHQEVFVVETRLGESRGFITKRKQRQYGSCTDQNKYQEINYILDTKKSFIRL